MAPLTAAWLRRRFAEVTQGEARPTVREEPGVIGQALIPASVLVPIVLRPSALTVLLTQRTAHLRDHAGQVSFPGGRCEPEDASPQATALREAREEVGIDSQQVELLGTLAEYRTSTGFAVRPVIGLVQPPLNLKLDDFEVADVFEPPLEFLLQPANFRRERIEYQGVLCEYWAVPWQGRYIWGATAGMLVNLREFLLHGM
jgi:8-oxo-dGTP pyrophosphatase MutT (NUDIX family)